MGERWGEVVAGLDDARGSHGCAALVSTDFGHANGRYTDIRAGSCGLHCTLILVQGAFAIEPQFCIDSKECMRVKTDDVR